VLGRVAEVSAEDYGLGKFARVQPAVDHRSFRGSVGGHWIVKLGERNMEFSGKRFLMIAGSMLGMLVLQSTLFYNLRIFGTRPDLILAVVGSIALLRGWAQGPIMGCFRGAFRGPYYW